MMRLTGKPTSRISNRLAIFAALLLVVTSLAGMSQTTPGSGLESHLQALESREQAPPVKIHSRGFKVSLFLFRKSR